MNASADRENFVAPRAAMRDPLRTMSGTRKTPEELGPPPGPDAAPGARARWARERAGMLVADLAKMIGISQPSLTNFETGRSRSNRKLALIAARCGVNYLWLSEGIGAPDAPAPDSGLIRDEAEATYLAEMGARIADLRKAASLSAARLAGGVGVAPGELAEIEKGMRWPGPVVLSRLAGELKTSLDWLVSGWTIDVYVTGMESHPLARVFHAPPAGGYRRET